MDLPHGLLAILLVPPELGWIKLVQTMNRLIPNGPDYDEGACRRKVNAILRNLPFVQKGLHSVPRCISSLAFVPTGDGALQLNEPSIHSARAALE